MDVKSVQITEKPKAEETNGTRLSVAMKAIRQQIAARSLVPGDKLPSIRRLAMTLHMSNSTVVEAYERLVAEGDSSEYLPAVAEGHKLRKRLISYS